MATNCLQCCSYAVVVSLLLLSATTSSQCRTFSFEMHHGFSKPVQKWFNHLDFPVKGTLDYYAALADRDHLLLLRRRHYHRHLSSDIGDTSIAFADGNSTLRISSMGFLHYATVSLGTPSKKFFVALDTGSDLLWVPCDCARCASTSSSTYGSDYELNIYDPKQSSTSRKVTCNNSLCPHRNRCRGTFSNCPYVVSYVSAETSSSGVLVEDVLHLTVEDADQGVFYALITFGCGQVQTGSFLDFAAPNGLFGLGMENISVPNILSRAGLVSDSFSMCFGRDGFGRISFGDKGSPDQAETPFSFDLLHPAYNINITQVRVGASLNDAYFVALFDSGTSFTYLVEPVYTQILESFDQQVQDRRCPPDYRMPFEYCYVMSSDTNSSLVPSMSLTMRGGSQYPVYDPIVVLSSRAELIYCLAVVKSADFNIIGQNFMTGYRIVFDREKLVLGWKEFDCYDMEDSNTSVNQQNSVEVGGFTDKDSENSDQIWATPQSEVSCSCQTKFKGGLAVLVLHLSISLIILFELLVVTRECFSKSQLCSN